MAYEDAESLEPHGDDSVIKALNKVYRPALTMFEEAHKQEHRFKKKFGYEKMGKRYDNLTKHAHGIRHKVLNRIEHLGGVADSRFESVDSKGRDDGENGGVMEPTDDIRKAYENTHRRLGQIMDRIGQANSVAQSANDHVTHGLLLKLHHKVDKKHKKIGMKRRQVKDMGDKYLLKA